MSAAPDDSTAADGADGPAVPRLLAPVPEDGRLRRGHRTRRAIVEAYLSLVEAGDRGPRVEEVAERAGVGLRTVYNQFRDLEGLRTEAGHIAYARIEHLALRLPVRGDRSARVSAFAKARAAYLEALTPYARSAEGLHHESPALAALRAELVRSGRREIEECFAPELAALRGRARTRVVDAVHVVANWPAWESLRDELGLPPAEAQAVLRTAVDAVVPATPEA